MNMNMTGFRCVYVIVLWMKVASALGAPIIILLETCPGCTIYIYDVLLLALIPPVFPSQYYHLLPCPIDDGLLLWDNPSVADGGTQRGTG